MADKKISQLTTLAQADVAVTADFLPIVDTSATETKKATPQSVVLGALGATSANVGIGTASPSQRLEVSGSIAVGGSSASTPSLNRAVFVQSNTNNDVVGYSLQIVDGTNNRRGSMFLDDSTGLWGWDVTASSGVPSYVWRVASAEVMRLTESGNLGIGTASPGSRLDVQGPAVTEASIRLTSLIDGTIATPRASSFSFRSGTTPSETARIASFNRFGNVNGGDLVFSTADSSNVLQTRASIDSSGNIVAGASAALATTATNGFLYVPTCAGTPTGTPTSITGMAPIVVNTTNNKLYFYSGGAWRDAGP